MADATPASDAVASAKTATAAPPAGRRFALRILLTGALGFLLTLLASTWLLVTEVLPVDNFYQQLALIENLETPVEVVAVGDSRMSQSFAAPPGTFNLAYASESFDQMDIKLRAFLDGREPPRMVLLQLNAHMFCDYRFDGDRRDYDAFFGDGWALSASVPLFDPFLRQRLRRYWTLWWEHGRIPNQSVVSERGAVLTPHRMRDSDELSEYLQRRLERRIREHTPSAGFAERGLQQRMRTLIDDLHARGIAVCAVTLPVTHFYRDAIAEVEAFQEARGLIQQITAEAGAPYLDFFDAVDGLKLYRNPDHLNKLGAERFTPMMLERCDAAVAALQDR